MLQFERDAAGKAEAPKLKAMLAAYGLQAIAKVTLSVTSCSAVDTHHVAIGACQNCNPYDLSKSHALQVCIAARL